jgi:hypothetical protein
MKTTVIAATLAMLVGGPLVASASETNSAVVTAYSATTRQPGDHTRAQKPPVRSQFVGPSELHHGLLPNGLMPNPFNYG